jgi:hypothetical protein
MLCRHSRLRALPNKIVARALGSYDTSLSARHVSGTGTGKP